MFHDFSAFNAEDVDDGPPSILVVYFRVQMKDDEIALGDDMRE